MANATIQMKGPGGAPAPAPPESFPLFDLYTSIMNFRGFTPVAASFTRYWDTPTYPTSATSTETSVSDWISAANAASPGDVIFLADDTYNNPGIQTLTNSGVTLAAETKGGAVINGDQEFIIWGDDVSVFGTNHTGVNDETGDNRGIFTLRGNDIVVGYMRMFLLTSTGFNNLWNVYFHGVRGRATQIEIDTKLADRACFRGNGNQSQFNRVDHCKDIDHRGTGDSGDIEFAQTAQNSPEEDSFWLIDNNYIKGWNNDGAGNRVRGSEREIMSLKSSSNIMIQNVCVGCTGFMNDRTTHRSTQYANWFDGEDSDRSGGPSIQGDDSLALFNYVRRTNGGGVTLQNDGLPQQEYQESNNSYADFNTIVESTNSFRLSEGGGGGTPLATDPNAHNNIINQDSGNAVTSTSHAGTDDWGTGGNIFKAPAGLSDPGITEETPDIELDNGYFVPTAGGNCDGQGDESGYHALCIVDILGNDVPASNPNSGCFQPGFDLSEDPRQKIIDAAGQ